MRLRIAAGLIAAALTVGALPVSAAATDEPSTESSSDETPVFGWSDAPGPTEDEADDESSGSLGPGLPPLGKSLTGRFWPGRSCVFEARADNPHPSTDRNTGLPDASGHGAWVNKSRPLSNCPDEAEVSIELQARGCWYVGDVPINCRWVTLASDSGDRYSEQQIAVHAPPCDTLQDTLWRTKVTVKVRVSRWLDKRDAEENRQTIACRPPE